MRAPSFRLTNDHLSLGTPGDPGPGFPPMTSDPWTPPVVPTSTTTVVPYEGKPKCTGVCELDWTWKPAFNGPKKRPVKITQMSYRPQDFRGSKCKLVNRTIQVPVGGSPPLGRPFFVSKTVDFCEAEGCQTSGEITVVNRHNRNIVLKDRDGDIIVSDLVWTDPGQNRNNAYNPDGTPAPTWPPTRVLGPGQEGYIDDVPKKGPCGSVIYELQVFETIPSGSSVRMNKLGTMELRCTDGCKMRR